MPVSRASQRTSTADGPGLPSPPDAASTPHRRLPALLPLAVVTGISPLATDMYLPGLPAMAVDLGTTPAVAQLSLTAFLVAFAVGMLVVGPVSDAVGRRRLMVAGTLLFALTSVACALAPDATVLLVARVLQGLAGAVGAVVGRAMVTDVLSGDRRARVIGLLSSINSVAPVVAPLLGGVLITAGGWRLTFWALALTGAALCVLVVATFPETLPPEARAHGAGVRPSLARMGTLLRIPRFSLYLVTSGVATVGFFAYIATSAFVFQRLYGYSESLYTLVFATNASCMIATTLLFSRLVGRVSEDRLLSVGLVVATLGSAGVLAVALTGGPGGALWACLAVVTGAQGLVITGTATRTQALGHALPGSAAALSGGLAFGVGGLGTPLAGLLGGTATAMGAVMLVGLGLGALLQTVVARRVSTPDL